MLRFGRDSEGKIETPYDVNLWQSRGTLNHAVYGDSSHRLNGTETVFHIVRFEKMKLVLINVLTENKNFFCLCCFECFVDAISRCVSRFFQINSGTWFLFARIFS